MKIITMNRNKAMPLIDQILLDSLESRYKICLAKLKVTEDISTRGHNYTDPWKCANYLLEAEKDDLIKQITDIKLKYPDNEEEQKNKV